MTDPVILALDELQADYGIVDCDPDLADTVQFCDRYGYQLDESANAILVVGKADPRVYAMCVVLATTQIDVNKVVRKKLGVKKASFASPAETTQMTGMTLGGVTPFGLPGTLPVWIDSKVMNCQRVIVGGGSRNRKIYVDPRSLEALPSADVIENLAKQPPAST